MLTQADVAEKIGQSQSFVSKCERGERRIDVVELRAYCVAFGISFAEFTQEFDRALNR
jgi:transcriptional regulator with XRE-family HTH domain